MKKRKLHQDEVKTDRQTYKQTHVQRKTYRFIPTLGTFINKQTEEQTNRHNNRQTDTFIDKQTQ